MKKFFAAASVVLVALGLTACGSFNKFADANTTCGNPSGVVVGDNGTTLSIDMMGEEDSYGASFSDVSCLIYAVSTPSYIISQMESTTALSGVQSAEFDGISVSWSYHPDNGLDIIYHKN